MEAFRCAVDYQKQKCKKLKYRTVNEEAIPFIQHAKGYLQAEDVACLLRRKEFTKDKEQLSPVEIERYKMCNTCSYTCGKGNWNGQAEIPNVEKHIILVSLLHSLDGDITAVCKLEKVCCALCHVCQSVMSVSLSFL